MRVTVLMLAATMMLTAVPSAFSQIVTPLPAPMVDENAPPGAFLRAARTALEAGRGREAMEALERAESRLLGRSVRPSQSNRPSQQPAVVLVSRARASLEAGDLPAALRGIDSALSDPRIDQPEP
jgi:hypothetical protein